VLRSARSRSSLVAFALPVAASILAIATSAGRARACATCGAGDPALAIAGAEQPFAGRVRLAAVLQHTSYEDVDGAVADQRVLLGGSVALGDVAMLSAALPLAWREVTYPDLSHDTTLGLGDADLRLRVMLARDRAFAPAHRLVLELGARVPTAPKLTRPDGRAPLPGQLGTGAFEPLIGLAWIARIDDTTLWLAAQGAFPTSGFAGWRNGAALRSSVSVQWQALAELALRALADVRLEGPSGFPQDEGEGLASFVFLGAGIVVAPAPDVVLHLLVRVPIAQQAGGAHAFRRDGPTIELGAALDV
jgi:hypothetical protein